MSLNRYAKRRDANEPQIVNALRKAGFSVERIDTPVDLIVGRYGYTHLVEVKMPKGRLTEHQQHFKDAWGGGCVHVVRSAEDALAELRICEESYS